MSEPETFSTSATPPVSESASLPAAAPAPAVPLSQTPALNEGGEAGDAGAADAPAAAVAVSPLSQTPALNEGADDSAGGDGGEPASPPMADAPAAPAAQAALEAPVEPAAAPADAGDDAEHGVDAGAVPAVAEPEPETESGHAPSPPLAATPALNEGAEAGDAGSPPPPGALPLPGLPASPAPALNEGAETPAADSDAVPPDAVATANTAPPAVPDLPPAATAALLAEHFPALFGAGRALPIKLRIQADIQQRLPGVFNKKSLSIFLHRATTSTAYLRALANAPQRLDLDGAPAGDIADEHRLAAAAELERRRAIVDARRQAERLAQRNAQQQDAQRGEQRSAQQAPGSAADGERPAAGDAAVPEQRPPHPRPPGPPRGDRQPRPMGTGPRAAQAQRPPGPAGQDRGQRPHGQPQQQRHSSGGAAHTDQRPGQRPDRQGHDNRPAARPDRPPRRDGLPGRQEVRNGPQQGAPHDQRPLREPHQPHHSHHPRESGEPHHPAAPGADRGTGASAAASVAFADPASRERAALLRQFEGSTLTKSNFCALKGLREAELDTQLALARQERGERQPPAGGGSAPHQARPAFKRPR